MEQRQQYGIEKLIDFFKLQLVIQAKTFAEGRE